MSTWPYTSMIMAPAPSRNLTVLSTVKSELGITDTKSDALLSRMITEQSVAAATYCDRRFEQETIVDSFRLSCNTDVLLLSRSPTRSIISVVEHGQALDTEGYELDAATGKLWRLNGDFIQDWAVAKVSVTHIGGYALLGDLAQDIERAVLIMIKESWLGRERDPNLRSVTVEGVGSRDYYGDTNAEYSALPPDAAALPEPYRKMIV